jgi:membrane-bound metal-dependent hydrolase YbcI (DUF457 family)
MDPIAHASVGLVAKAVYPKAPLLPLVIATEVPDLFFFAFQAAGIERQAVTRLDFGKGLEYLAPAVFPFSHGLWMCVVWSSVACGIGFLLYRHRPTGLLLGLMVFSHWVLDFLVYDNLPLFFNGSPLLGIGLLSTGVGVMIGIALEAVLIVGGITAYLVSKRKKGIPAHG